MGTITTYSWCAVKDGRAYKGSKEDILSQLSERWGIDSKRRLFIKWTDRKEVTILHGYTDEWEGNDLYQEMIKDLFGKLPQYGFTIYRNIGK